MKVLVVVDMQHDFVDGVLGTPEAQAIVPNVAMKVARYRGDVDSVILYTRDTHYDNYLETLEGQDSTVLSSKTMECQVMPLQLLVTLTQEWMKKTPTTMKQRH